MKKFLATVLALCMVFALCAAASAEPAKEITLWTYPIGKWVDAETMDALMADFEAATGIKVTVEYLDYTSGDDQVNTAIEGKAAPDLIMEGPERLVMKWGVGGFMAPLNDLYELPEAEGVYDSLKKACQVFREKTGCEFQAMGELEYYVIAEDDNLFPATDQRGYHESGPFAKFNQFRTQCMHYIAQAGGQIKYGHSEVGNFTLGGKIYEQNEIEFLPTAAEDAADQLTLAKWIIRNLGYQQGYDVTFAPKITSGKAGSGLHIHMKITKDGRSQMIEDGALSPTARKAIAGMMVLAPSITAFGNKVPTSYFRLVPHQEAPTNVCWGDRNRSVLVRVPLGWTAGGDMSCVANPLEKPSGIDTTQKQTVEMRSPDGSADVYQLIAALCVACRIGIEMPDALQIAEDKYVNVNIHDAQYADKLAHLEQLPDSCQASAKCLQKQREFYEKEGVFSPNMIDGIISQLEGYRDGSLRKEIENRPQEMLHMVKKYFHCG